MGINKRTREIVYKKYDGHCAYCGRRISMKEMQVDHFYSKYKYEKLRPVVLKAMEKDNLSDSLKKQIDEIPVNIDDVSNLMPACRACNFRKGSFTLSQFRDELRKQAANEMKRFQARQSADFGLIEYHDRPIVFYFEKPYVQGQS